MTVAAQTLQFRISPELASRLEKRLKETGQEPDDYLTGLVEKDLSAPASSLAEIFAPVQKEFRESGMTEDELDAFLDELREESQQERKIK